jgi:hypothetical protein
MVDDVNVTPAFKRLRPEVVWELAAHFAVDIGTPPSAIQPSSYSVSQLVGYDDANYHLVTEGTLASHK